MMTILKRIGWPYWAVSIVLGVVLPIILHSISIGGMWRSGMIYGLGYSIIAGLLGYFVKHRGERWWLLFTLPVLFSLGIYLSGPKYALYFAPVYLCISYLAYGLSATQRK